MLAGWTLSAFTLLCSELVLSFSVEDTGGGGRDNEVLDHIGTVVGGGTRKCHSEASWRTFQPPRRRACFTWVREQSSKCNWER